MSIGADLEGLAESYYRYGTLSLFQAAELLVSLYNLLEWGFLETFSYLTYDLVDVRGLDEDEAEQKIAEYIIKEGHNL